MLGLHEGSFLKAFVVVLVLALIAYCIIRLLSEGGEVAAMLVPLGIVAFVAVAGIGWAVVNSAENNLNARDKLIRAELAEAGITAVQLKTDDSWEIRRDGCTAVFTVKSRDEIDRASRPWPLVLGTGLAVSGCEGKKLDTLFGPPHS